MGRTYTNSRVTGITGTVKVRRTPNGVGGAGTRRVVVGDSRSEVGSGAGRADLAGADSSRGESAVAGTSARGRDPLSIIDADAGEVAAG